MQACCCAAQLARIRRYGQCHMINTCCRIGCALLSVRVKCRCKLQRRSFGDQPLARVVAASGALSAVLSREWLLEKPDSQLRQVILSTNELTIVQDDLLHPVLGGNKLRKLDGLLPEVKGTGCTDLLTCGGLQSAHTAAVAAACAEQGIKAHLLVRGERPAVPTGFHLLARMFAQVTYVPRSEYADRPAMFQRYADQIKTSMAADINLHVLPEGASEPAALLGCIRLVQWLAQPHVLGPQPLSLVVDCGTGTTATGLALGIKLAGLPWTVCGVMLAGPTTHYTHQQTDLTASFTAKYLSDQQALKGDLPVSWVQRPRPRRFGKVFRDDVFTCQQVAQNHGILLDPIYSLAAWEVATQMMQTHQGDCRTVMLHTGGALGLQGVAQRYPEWF